MKGKYMLHRAIYKITIISDDDEEGGWRTRNSKNMAQQIKHVCSTLKNTIVEDIERKDMVRVVPNEPKEDENP